MKPITSSILISSWQWTGVPRDLNRPDFSRWELRLKVLVGSKSRGLGLQSPVTPIFPLRVYTLLRVPRSQHYFWHSDWAILCCGRQLFHLRPFRISPPLAANKLTPNPTVTPQNINRQCLSSVGSNCPQDLSYHYNWLQILLFFHSVINSLKVPGFKTQAWV